MLRYVLAALGLALSLAFANHAAAFGTIRSLGQNAEHERITRAALADFAPLTLDEIAGKNGTFGAVGAPDHPMRGLMSRHEAHCDGGDYLATPGYGQAQAEAQRILESCRAWSFRWLEAAVAAAAPLAAPTAQNTALECAFDGAEYAGKCAVLEYLGVALHASQDFYSHSNWSDRAAAGATGPRNPPGLGHEGRAPWFDPRAEAAFPAGLISGCYDGFPESFYCRGRVKHDALNKDKGPIGDSGATGRGTTSRGRINGNFERAVAAAIADTADKWLYFQERVRAVYGEEAGARIICVVRSDAWEGC